MMVCRKSYYFSRLQAEKDVFFWEDYVFAAIFSRKARLKCDSGKLTAYKLIHEVNFLLTFLVARRNSRKLRILKYQIYFLVAMTIVTRRVSDL